MRIKDIILLPASVNELQSFLKITPNFTRYKNQPFRKQEYEKSQKENWIYRFGSDGKTHVVEFNKSRIFTDGI